MVATLNSGGVRELPFLATNSTVKSRVIRARCMANTASTAANSTSHA